MNPSLRCVGVRRLGALLALLVLLAGCQRTLFQNPPAAADACDPDLVGRWLSQGDGNDEPGELQAIVDANCALFTIERKASGPRQSEPTTLRNARVGGVRYVWLDAAWANRTFEVDPNLLDQPGDVYLFAYSVSRGHLRLAAPPHRALARRVLDKDIPGDVLLHGDELTVRVSGEPDAIRKTLGKHRLFRLDDALHMRRADAAGTP